MPYKNAKFWLLIFVGGVLLLCALWATLKLSS